MIRTSLVGICGLVSGVTAEWRCDPGIDVQRIYFANHSSHLDFLVIWSALPPRLRPLTRPVAGRDYWEGGGIRRFLAGRVFRAILVERSADHTASAARATIELMAREMGATDSLIVFPEGTRSADGVVGRFRSGLYHLSAAKPDAELIPVHLENLNRILPKGEALPVPLLSRVTFGTPLPRIAHEPKEAFLARARIAVLQMGAET